MAMDIRMVAQMINHTSVPSTTASVSTEPKDVPSTLITRDRSAKLTSPVASLTPNTNLKNR